MTTESFENEAVNLARLIRARHMPHLTVWDPICASPTDDTIVSYTRVGDTGIWTGHYLAAEALRYAVTGAPDALEYAETALTGLELMVDATEENGLLSRGVIPHDSPYLEAIKAEEGDHGIRWCNFAPVWWISNVTRDQYAGVFFGLSVAFEHMPALQHRIAVLVTKMVNYVRKQWFPWVLGTGKARAKTPLEFRSHPELIMAMMAIARQVNPGEFDEPYRRQRSSIFTSGILPWLKDLEANEVHRSYHKFNLAYINFFTLLRLDPEHKRYRESYWQIRAATREHGNAHFDAIAGAVDGEDTGAGVRSLLEQWLERPRRDEWRDWRETHAGEGDRANDPISVKDRVCTDFLWQRSPFLRIGGGSGYIEGAGIDFILPFWLAKFYGL